MLTKEKLQGIASAKEPSADGVASTVSKESVVHNPQVLSVARRTRRLNGRRWVILWSTNFAKLPRIPFEEGIKRLTWFAIGDLANALEELGHPGDMTVLELMKRVDAYLLHTEQDDHAKAYESCMDAIGAQIDARHQRLIDLGLYEADWRRRREIYNAVDGNKLAGLAFRKAGA